jgi:hypothetical protein
VSFVLERHTDKPPTTANKYAGLSLPARRRVVRDWRKWAKDEAVDRGWSSITVPVSVDVVHLRPNHASMPDVTALQPVAKALVDGLVDAKVLAGDGPQHVRSMCFRAPDVCGEHGVRLIIRELEQHLPQPAFTPPSVSESETDP